MVKIGHASASETKGKSGQKGDQTGGEVCIRDFYIYPGGYSYVLRPTDPNIAEKAALACEKGCKNNFVGYGQPDRNTAHSEAQRVGYDLEKINRPCNTDCSAYMTLCEIAAGVKGLEYVGNAPTTRNMKQAFLRTGQFTLLTDPKYLTGSEYLKRGDVLVAEGHHTVMVLGNGAKSKKSIADAVEDVLKGLYGDGANRKAKLKSEGFTDVEIMAIQAEINARKSAQHIDQVGIDFLKQFEGCRLTAYKLKGDSNYTIGYGHCGADVLPNMTISQQRAEEIFRLDLVQFEKYVKHYVKDIVLTQNRLNALVSYCYNRGPKGLKQLADNSHTAKEYADNLVVYWGTNQTYKEALIKRRKAERELFLR